ncbi:MAG: APC family permease [Acidobacteriia bacterium]|nr:APC family permease [Terriglobia bacterium]
MTAPGSSTASTVRKASLFYFVFVMFSYTTGGPFGLESMVSSSGPGMSLLYLLVIPFFLSVPVSLVAAELTTAMPVEGGFYRWTRAAFGDFWGFLAGWWNWSASFLLGGSYAVLFTDYLGYYFPGIVGWKHWLVSFALIAFISWVNILGIQMVGKAATIFELLMFIPVIAMIALGLAKWHHNPFVPMVPPNQPFFKVFGGGLALAIWLYSGYEQLSSVAEDVENPQRSYPRALALVIPLSIATYFLPPFAALAALGDWGQWKDGYFSTAALLIGGPWLGNLMTIGAMIGNVALLNSTMLTATPMPFVLAEDGYLPPFLTRRHSRYGTPWIAILISAAIYASLALHSLGELISIYAFLRGATTVLTVLSAWGLRRKRQDLPRAFRIPWGNLGLIYVIATPLAMTCVALLNSEPIAKRWGPWALAAGPVVYFVVKWFAKRAAQKALSIKVSL